LEGERSSPAGGPGADHHDPMERGSSMSTHFAGSRFLNERRQRRLAGDSDGAPALPSAAGKSPAARPSTPSTVNKNPMSAALPPSHFPVRKALSRRLWKHWGIAFLGLACLAGILFAQEAAETHAERLGPGFVRLFDKTPGRATTFFNAMMVMLSGQLALFIWWVRSRNPQAKRRIWPWVAGAAFGAALCMIADAHLALSETICWIWARDIWKKEVLGWMAPLALAAAALLVALQGSMRGCRSGLTMIWLGAVSGGVWCALRLDFEIHPLVTPYADMALAGTAMLGNLCVFMAMLFQARSAAYEPAQVGATRRTRFGLRLPGLRMPRFNLRSKTSAPTSKTSAVKARTAAPAQKSDAARQAAKPQPAASKPSLQAQPKPVETAREQHRSSAPQPHIATQAARRDAAPDDDDDDDDDDHIDPALLRGLSKRDRRKMRKQYRDQQREERMQA
jgi:hypothetical protein